MKSITNLKFSLKVGFLSLLPNSESQKPTKMYTLSKDVVRNSTNFFCDKPSDSMIKIDPEGPSIVNLAVFTGCIWNNKIFKCEKNSK